MVDLAPLRRAFSVARCANQTCGSVLSRRRSAGPWASMSQEILFEWFRSGPLIGDLRRPSRGPAEIDLVYQEHLAKARRKSWSIPRRGRHSVELSRTSALMSDLVAPMTRRT